jgi:CcmD family protein
MSRLDWVWRAVLLVVTLAIAPVTSVSVAAQQQPPPKAAQDEFVPVDQLPPQEQLPAAPLLIAAYSVAWVLVTGYLFSIWRRLGRVERELAEVSQRVQQRRS